MIAISHTCRAHTRDSYHYGPSLPSAMMAVIVSCDKLNFPPPRK